MKKLLMLIACASAAFFAAFAGEDEVTVKVSVAGTVNNSALKKQCEVKGKKEAVKKYLLKQNSNMEEKVIADAMASYAKFVEGIEADEQEYEDGELTCSFTVTIKQEELAQWLKGEGVDLNAAADGSSIRSFLSLTGIYSGWNPCSISTPSLFFGRSLRCPMDAVTL